jgi:CubicO group peptidase (beta-lactamase class C family)
LLGSTSKAFTALVTARLIDAGKLDLDAPVRQYLSSFQMGENEYPACAWQKSLRFLVS